MTDMLIAICACLIGAMFLQRDVTKAPAYIAVTELHNGTAARHAQKRNEDLLPKEQRPDSPLSETITESQLLS